MKIFRGTLSSAPVEKARRLRPLGKSKKLASQAAGGKTTVSTYFDRSRKGFGCHLLATQMQTAGNEQPMRTPRTQTA